ncbi:MAG: glycosyltransferase family 2 protein [Myxococcota bacterium]
MPLVSSTLALLTLPGTLELLGLTVAGALPPRRRSAPTRTLRRLAVVIPAHNEESVVRSAVRSIMACESAPCPVSVFVIADNCSDRTATAAGEAGAQVLVRNDPLLRGKGYALEYAFRVIGERHEDVDAFLVVDADTTVDANFLRATHDAFASGAAAVQCRYLIQNPEASPRVRLMGVAFMAFNVLRPRGRDRLGLSAGILGNGFGLARETVKRVPYTARSVVEDLEYHLELVRTGLRVEFVDETAVRAIQPDGEQANQTQRSRWEGGRFRMIREHVPQLLHEVVRGKPRLTEPLLELLLLPLGFHVGSLGVLLMIPFPPTQLYAAGALGVVAAHVATALRVGKASREDLVALGKAPFYVAWKLRLLPQIFRASQRDQEWVRTERDREAPVATA